MEMEMKVLFQSPIGTNKTNIVKLKAGLNVRVIEFQSPIGTNKTIAFLPDRGSCYMFQSPIGTNKTVLHVS